MNHFIVIIIFVLYALSSQISNKPDQTDGLQDFIEPAHPFEFSNNEKKENYFISS